MGRSRVAATACFLVAGCLISGPLLADWKRDYQRAERAARDGQWAEAEQLFRSAARDEPTPDARKRFEGVVFRDYAPHFWAGISAWRQGACDRAMDYWQDSANSPAVLANIKDFKAQQDRGIADCQRQLAATKPPAPTPTPTPTSPPVATTTPTPKPAPPATTTTSPPASTTRPPAQTTTPPVTQQTPPPRPTPSPGSNRPAPPRELVSAVEAWIAGRYNDLLAINPASISDGRARAHVHMLRAAARHAEADLGNASSLQAAQDEVRSARRALASLTPDATLFSPRFRAFWQATR